MSKSVILSVFAICIFGLVACEPVKYFDCSEGKAMATLQEVDITPCSSKQCILKKGTNETVEVTFTPKETIEAATTVVHGKIGPLFVPFPVKQSDACQGQGITCPMKAGKEYTFKTMLPIKSLYPSIQVVVKWEMRDQSKQIVYCWEVTTKIE